MTVFPISAVPRLHAHHPDHLGHCGPTEPAHPWICRWWGLSSWAAEGARLFLTYPYQTAGSLDRHHIVPQISPYTAGGRPVLMDTGLWFWLLQPYPTWRSRTPFAWE